MVSHRFVVKKPWAGSSGDSAPLMIVGGSRDGMASSGWLALPDVRLTGLALPKLCKPCLCVGTSASRSEDACVRLLDL